MTRQLDTLATEADVAELLGTTERTVAAWRRTYNWPYTRFGRSIRFTSEQVEQIIASHAQENTAEPAVAIAGQTKRSARRSA